MGTIKERTLKDGSKSYLAQIIRRKHGVQESQTFKSRQTAAKWVTKREGEINADIEAGRLIRKPSDKRVTLGDAIDMYVKESLREIGDTKAQVLRTIRKEYDIAEMPCDRITSAHIVSFVKELHNRPGLNSTATVLNYLSHLAAVFSTARPMWGFELDQQAMRDAQKVCSNMGFTGKSAERDRRPTMQELDKLMTHFEAASQADSRTMPMHVVMAFAIFSTRRQSEICRITWDDYEADHKRVMVRKMKNPGDKGGVDRWTNLPDPCAAIIDARPRQGDKIFPYNSDTVSRRFTEACKVLGIEDLHFHDLRHEGTSRLFELGWHIPDVADVTGHKTWTSLKRYSHIRDKGDKFVNWLWIDKIT
jgi:integrase